MVRLGADGIATTVRTIPDPDAPDLLAVLRLDGNRRVTRTDRDLAAAVFRRHTNRRPFLERLVAPVARVALKSGRAS
ncbi:hypothetical protein [Amycolatopsis sp.]|uniref:hypothetical protein n=1 Tax=Amycolatopsis sp. TaxID=37632 RepID=UPI002D7FFC34|nr:hypothetical protein [Amycolatopsis sp.]HET6703327.1 hypothetical protein [Amycolatopsis sp.]